MGKRYYWLKLQEDFFSCPQIKKLRRIAGGDTFTIIYLKMQLLSIKSGGVIEYQGIESSFEEELSLILDEDLDNVKVTFAFLVSQGLIEQSDDRRFLLTQAAKNIGTECESAARMRAFRQSKALPASQCDANVQSCDKKVTLDIDKDKEKDKDKEYMPPKSPRGGTTATKKQGRFIPPTAEDVRAYCTERGNRVDPQRFVDFYTANGWTQGRGKPIKDWRAAVRTWESREQQRAPTQRPALTDDDYDLDRFF